jgi:hypothetical protein
MKCYYCGADVPENQKYCIYCGTEQAKSAEIPMWNDLEREISLRDISAGSEEPVSEVRYVMERGIQEPRIQLPVQRGLGKMFFLGLLTLGIYPVVIWSRMVTELNITASRHDGKRTMPYFAMLLLTPLTLGVFGFVWMHKFCGRIRGELARRGIRYRFGPRDFWLWNVLGMLILVGPFVFVHKLTKAMNRINTDFNSYG